MNVAFSFCETKNVRYVRRVSDPQLPQILSMESTMRSTAVALGGVPNSCTAAQRVFQTSSSSSLSEADTLLVHSSQSRKSLQAPFADVSFRPRSFEERFPNNFSYSAPAIIPASLGSRSRRIRASCSLPNSVRKGRTTLAARLRWTQTSSLNLLCAARESSPSFS